MAVADAVADTRDNAEYLALADANANLLAQQREIISRKRLKPFTKRTDIHGIVRLAVHSAMIGGSGWLIYLATGTGWLIPAMLLHGILLGHLFAPMHECSHGTAFRTRWLNETVLWVTGIIIVWSPLYFRYDHAGHHTFAQQAGRDPQFAVPKGSSWADYIYYTTGIHQWIKNGGWVIRHASGRMAPFQRRFVPENELPRIYLEARVMVAVYAAVAVGAIVFQTWAPVIRGIQPANLCPHGEDRPHHPVPLLEHAIPLRAPPGTVGAVPSPGRLACRGRSRNELGRPGIYRRPVGYHQETLRP